MNSETFTCPQCGQEHHRGELELSYKRPDVVNAMPSEQRAAEVSENDDGCRTKDGRFFIRGGIPLDIAGRDQPYRIGAWVELDQASFERVAGLWSDPNQGDEPAFPAKLANNIRLLPSTLGLPVQLKLTGETSRPDILVPASSHPLHHEQCTGISGHRAFEYSEGLA